MIRFAENLNKMITAGLGGALEAPSTEVAVGHRVRYMDASGPVANFETNVVAPIRSLRVDMRPIQEGSGDPSPDNVRPITGRDSVTVERTGVNLFPNPSGARSAVDLKAGVEYCFSAKGASSAVAVAGKYADGATFPTLFLNKLSGDIRYNSRVLEKDVSEIIIYLNNVTLYDCQIEVGSTPSAYASYNVTSVTVQLGQTVYGGTVDVTGGSAENAMAAVDMGDLTWGVYNSAFYANIPGMTTANAKATELVCSMYKNVGSITATVVTAMNENTFGKRATYAQIFVKDSSVSTAADFKAKVTGQTLVYPLAEPFAIQLTPAQLTTLRGDNAVWSDAGDVTLEYPYYEETEGY